MTRFNRLHWASCLQKNSLSSAAATGYLRKSDQGAEGRFDDSGVLSSKKTQTFIPMPWCFQPVEMRNGAAGGIRTRDLSLTKGVLYP